VANKVGLVVAGGIGYIVGAATKARVEDAAETTTETKEGGKDEIEAEEKANGAVGAKGREFRAEENTLKTRIIGRPVLCSPKFPPLEKAGKSHQKTGPTGQKKVKKTQSLFGAASPTS